MSNWRTTECCAALDCTCSTCYFRVIARVISPTFIHSSNTRRPARKTTCTLFPHRRKSAMHLTKFKTGIKRATHPKSIILILINIKVTLPRAVTKYNFSTACNTVTQLLLKHAWMKLAIYAMEIITFRAPIRNMITQRLPMQDLNNVAFS